MKFSKFCFMLAAAVFAAGAFADALNVLVSFYSEDDYYADGTQVLPGEWYALCWSPRSKFGGITYDFKPVVDGDVICDMMPRAEKHADGTVGCKFTVFQADSSMVQSGGNYFVYLLDTRNAEGTDVAKTKESLFINSAAVSGSYTAESFSSNGKKKPKKRNATASTVAKDNNLLNKWGESSLPTEFDKPSISGFRLLDDAKVEISVVGMVPGVNYNVRMGSGPSESEMTSYRIASPKSAASKDQEVPFIVSAENANFFQIIRHRYDQKMKTETTEE
jgi:hypothetical protein